LVREDAATVRRSALSALRFLSSAKAVEEMCRGLLKDPDPMVREQTAWSMRWSSSHDQERVECLITAAATDQSKRVRLEAVRSLVVLAPESKRAESALVHLTGPQVAPSVHRVALEALSELWNRQPGQDGLASTASE
jgi:HEAT repeat protein